MVDEVFEADTCPECGEGTIVFKNTPATGWLECDNCGARWNDRGVRVAVCDM